MDNSVLDPNSQPVLWDDPNKFARPAGIEIFDDRVVMRGYQEFILTAETLAALEEDRNLKKEGLRSSFSILITSICPETTEPIQKI